jgi:HlyD family secretion protein
MRRRLILLAAAGIAAAAACREAPGGAPPGASGYVDATEVRVASRVAGRVVEVTVAEGARVEVGDTLVRLSTTEIGLAIDRARAERDQAAAALRLVRAGARAEEIRQATAEAAAAQAEARAADAELAAARTDEARFEQLLRSRAGSQKQRDDALARRKLAEARLGAAESHVRAAATVVERLNAGPRPEEIAAARARVAATDAEIARLEQDRREATVVSPAVAVVSSRLVEPGEFVGPGAPLVVLVDLDRAWANVYVEEPLVPALRIGAAATVVTDAGDRLAGTIAFISPHAEFTPRNVQTAAERAKLVYRIKVTVDNRAGVLKPGMPVSVEWTGSAR